MQINRIQQEVNVIIGAGKKITNLSIADFTFFPSLLNEKKLAKKFAKIFEYPYYQPLSKGDDEARESLVAYYKHKKINLKAENIILTSGSSESYLYLFKIFSENNGEILFPSPSYPLFEEISRLVNLKLKYYKLDPKNDWQPDLKSIKSKINKNTKAIVLISPNNPTGSIISQKSFEEILEIANKHKLAIISDEVFSEFIFDSSNYISIVELAQKNFPNQLIFTLEGLSKGFGLPGLKLSWITLHGESSETKIYAEKLEYLADIFLTANQFSQLMLPDILKYGKKWQKNFLKRVEKNRDLTMNILSKCQEINFSFTQGGFYVFPSIDFTALSRANLNDEEFTLKLLKEKKIYVHPGYYYDYPENCHFLICFLQDPKVLKKTLKKIVDFVKSL